MVSIFTSSERDCQHTYHIKCKYIYMQRTRLNPNLGKEIERRRKELGLSQDQLAAKIGHVSRPAISGWESGDTKNIRLSNLVGLANVFDITIEELLTGEIPQISAHHVGGEPIKYNDVEKRLIDRFHALRDDQRDLLLAFLESFTTQGITAPVTRLKAKDPDLTHKK